ncbi:hypothetical protein BDW62DRAFT_206667 [Aspergillus aurantiobrunneus]
MSSLADLHLVGFNETEPYKAEVPSAQWQDELTRFQNWASTIRAQRTGLDSLDYRLRESSHITSWLEPALERMQNLLRHIEHVPKNVAPGEGRVSSNSSVTVLQIVYNNLHDAINSLERICDSILHPAPHDRRMSIKTFKEFLPFDLKFLREKYPTTSSELIERLASANAQRRAILLQRHDQKQPGRSLGEILTGDAMYGIFAIRTFWNKLAIAPPPLSFANGGEFECPYCFWTMSLPDEHAWHVHVLHDLMAYICVVPECSKSRQMYETHDEWYHHVIEEHPRELLNQACPLCKSPGLEAASMHRHIAMHLEEIALFALCLPGSHDDGVGCVVPCS